MAASSPAVGVSGGNAGVATGAGAGRVQVFARVRPAASQETGFGPAVDIDDAGNSVRIRNDADAVERVLGGQAADAALSEGKEFAFDGVFPTASRQRDVFAKVGLPVLKECMRGFNGTILAYGQTGSGKTHSLLNQAQNSEEAGLLPRLIASLFLQVAQDGANVYTVEAGAVQVYNEQVDDLLHPEHQTGGGHNVKVQDGGILPTLTWRQCRRPEEMIEAFSSARANLVYAETKMNKASSRSHAVFQIRISKRERAAAAPEGSGARRMECVSAKLCVVDLAGSERVKKSGAEGQQFKEATNINKSLLAFGNVVSALAAKKAHIPLRDSKLTRILDGCIGGNCKTSLLVCASPAVEHAGETINTFEFASRAMRVEVNAKVNVAVVEVSAKALLADLSADADLLGGVPLGKELQELRRKNIEAAQQMKDEAKRRETFEAAAKAREFELKQLSQSAEQRRQETEALKKSEEALKSDAVRLREAVDKAEKAEKEWKTSYESKAKEAAELRAAAAGAEKAAKEWKATAEKKATEVEVVKQKKVEEKAAAATKEEVTRVRLEAAAEQKKVQAKVEESKKKLEEVEARARSAEEKIRAETEAIAELRGRFDSVEAERAELSDRLATAESQLNAERRRAADATRIGAEEAIQLREQSEAVERRADGAEQRASALEAEVAAAAEAIREQSAALAEAKSSLERFRAEAESSEQKLRDTFEQKLEEFRVEREEQLEALRSELAVSEEQARSTLEEEREAFTRRVAEFEESLAAEAAAWAEEKASIEAAAGEALEAQRQGFEARLEQGREEADARLRAAEATAEAKIAELQNTLDAKEAEFARSEAELKQSKEMAISSLREDGNVQQRRLAAAFKAARAINAAKEAEVRQAHDDLSKRFAARESREEDVEEIDRQRRYLESQQKHLRTKEGDLKYLSLELQNRDTNDRIFGESTFRRQNKKTQGIVPPMPGRKVGDIRSARRSLSSSGSRPFSAGGSAYFSSSPGVDAL